MITHPSASKIKHVMKTDPVSVRTDDTIETVAQTIEKYDLVALPVVDSIGRLVGRITVDDVMDEVREQAERDYQLASGISQDVETTDTVLTQTSARLPWLLIGMIGGLANSVILGNLREISPSIRLWPCLFRLSAVREETSAYNHRLSSYRALPTNRCRSTMPANRF